MDLVAIFLVVLSVLLPVEAFAFNCSVASTPVGFGSYDVFATVPLDSTGTITISCSNPEKKPIPVQVSLSPGASGSFNPRQMRLSGGSDRMNYYLFSDPSQTTIWGDTTGGTSVFTGTITRNSTLNATVYARVPARQDLRAGFYSDSLLVTVAW